MAVVEANLAKKTPMAKPKSELILLTNTAYDHSKIW